MPIRNLADARDQVHRQAAQPLARGKRRRRLQLGQNLVGARDYIAGYAVGIGAAAAGADIAGARDLALDIAAQRAMGRDAALDGFKPCRLGIEPVVIAVEHDRRRRALLRRQCLDRLKRGQIAVKPADHVERLSLDVRCARKDGRRIGVVDRTNASRRLDPFPLRGGSASGASRGGAKFIPRPLSARRRSSSPGRRCSRSNGRRRGCRCPRYSRRAAPTDARARTRHASAADRASG